MSENIERSFLKSLIFDEAEVTLHLTSGAKLRGQVADYNDTCVLLHHYNGGRRARGQLVYRHAISMIRESSLSPKDDSSNLL